MSDVQSIYIPIINSGLIPGGQSLSNRQTVFFLLLDPMDKSHKDPDVIDLSVPRHAQYLHEAWKRDIKTQFFGSTSILLLRNTSWIDRDPLLTISHSIECFRIPGLHHSSCANAQKMCQIQFSKNTFCS